jgi:hypothetical protein
MSQTQQCPTCHGSGKVPNPKTGQPMTCPTCNGTGVVSVTLDDLPFWYPINPPSLTALQANVQANVVIDNDADFEWRWIVASSVGTYSVSLVDRFTSRPLMPSNINGENIAGTAQLPFILPKPYLIRRTSTIAASFTDRSGGGANVIQFALVGYKLAG